MSLDERLARLEEKLELLMRKVDRIEKAMYYGNGESIVERITRLESEVESLNVKMKLVIAVVGTMVSLLPVIMEVLSRLR